MAGAAARGALSGLAAGRLCGLAAATLSGPAAGALSALALGLVSALALGGGPATARAEVTVAPAAAPASPPAAHTLRLLVYFNRVATADEAAAECDSVRPLTRQLPRTPAVATAALRALFAGPTEVERAAGWRSPFSPATADLLLGLRLVRGTAYVDLTERPELMAAASSSCGAAELLVAIERTLRQFASVQRVIVAIDGDPRRFYEAVGLRCDASNDQCDKRPFQPAAGRP